MCHHLCELWTLWMTIVPIFHNFDLKTSKLSLEIAKITKMGCEKLKWIVILWNAKNCFRMWIFREYEFTDTSLHCTLFRKLQFLTNLKSPTFLSSSSEEFRSKTLLAHRTHFFREKFFFMNITHSFVTVLPTLHSVEVSEFFCHSDFTWNHFWEKF